MTDAPRDNLKGGAWLVLDLSLNVWSLSLVKWLGTDFPAAQVVFFRALVGLVMITPLILAQRDAFRCIPHPRLQVLRVTLSAVTLIASFFAIARLPLATFTAISFTRPIITMLLAAILLREQIGLRGWIAGGLALLGVIIAVDPVAVAWSHGLAAMVVVVFSASFVVVATRALRATPSIVLMTFYTCGLTLLSAPFAFYAWQPPAASDLGAFLLIGCFAQAAQFCFLRAHFHGTAGYLSVLSYLSLVFSVTAGYVFFDEVPGARFAIGALLIVAASLWVSSTARRDAATH